MTIEAATPTAGYTIAGTGPYAITWPYDIDAVTARVLVAGSWVALTPGDDFTVSPTSATDEGDLTLSAGAATTHAGRALRIDRATVREQGWEARANTRERGLEVNLDRMVMALQEQDAKLATAFFLPGVTQQPSVLTPDTVPVFDGTRFVSGPSPTQIAAAAALATAAAGSATAAAGSATAAAGSATAAAGSATAAAGSATAAAEAADAAEAAAATAAADAAAGIYSSGVDPASLVLNFATGFAGIGYAVRDFRWERAGKLIYVYGSMKLSGKGVQTGQAFIGNLPFPVFGTAHIMHFNSYGFMDAGVQGPIFGVPSLTPAGNPGVALFKYTAGVGIEPLTNVDFTNSSFLQFAMQYVTP